MRLRACVRLTGRASSGGKRASASGKRRWLRIGSQARLSRSTTGRNPSMQSSLYVALSGQVALQKRLDTIANNIANMNTGGFRAEEVSFSTVLSRRATRRPPSPAAAKITFRAGLAKCPRTGNPLDIAVQGDGWFAVQDAGWRRLHARRTAAHETRAASLLTVNNYPILDAGGASILLDPNAGSAGHFAGRHDQPGRAADRRGRPLPIDPNRPSSAATTIRR